MILKHSDYLFIFNLEVLFEGGGGEYCTKTRRRLCKCRSTVIESSLRLTIPLCPKIAWIFSLYIPRNIISNICIFSILSNVVIHMFRTKKVCGFLKNIMDGCVGGFLFITAKNYLYISNLLLYVNKRKKLFIVTFVIKHYWA